MDESLFSLSAYRFDVPKECIAQYPAEPRDSARLMIVDRASGRIDEGIVADLPSLLSPHDALILNNTRVLHASLHGTVDGKRGLYPNKLKNREFANAESPIFDSEKTAPISNRGLVFSKSNLGFSALAKTDSSTCLGIQCLLTKAVHQNEWWVLAKPARILTIGATVLFAQGVRGVVKEVAVDGQRLIVFSESLTPERLQTLGSIPLPPYIQRPATEEIDAKRYQTIYGSHFGSVAAPTAGLHFTESMFSNLAKRQVESHFVTLHVGTGTFLPIRTPDIRMHLMHTESFEISEQTASAINSLPPSSRRVAVGTTSCRVLETVAHRNGDMCAGVSSTNLFIYPGYNFKCVSSLLTNFHTPESSLLVLVSAFMGHDLMKEAYQKAIERKFRLFSYGDAMLII